MASFNDHPTVRLVREQVQRQSRVALPNLDAAELRRFCLNAGADDIGFVAFSRPELDDQRDDILKFFPATKTLISFVCRMNREPIRNPARSVANLEFHDTTHHVN